MKYRLYFRAETDTEISEKEEVIDLTDQVDIEETAFGKAFAEAMLRLDSPDELKKLDLSFWRLE